jgi:hypothetical protein
MLLARFDPKTSVDEGVPDLIEWNRSQTAPDQVERANAELAKRGLTQ